MSPPAPDATTSANAVGPQLMRSVLGHFASGVTVITAHDGTQPIGFTCQSFSSLSLDPPLVTFCPARSSTTWPRVRALGRFCVNVLAESHAELSAQFARSGTEKYAGVGWQPSPQGSPVLDGVVAWIDCELWAEYDGGDHTIVAATVRGVGEDQALLPLVFHRGGYGLAHPVLTPRVEESD